jgi:hypothetical protein
MGYGGVWVGYTVYYHFLVADHFRVASFISHESMFFFRIDDAAFWFCWYRLSIPLMSSNSVGVVLEYSIAIVL